MLTPNLDINLVCNNGELQLEVFDCTGSYDDPLNTGGFGVPNADITEVTSTILQVVFPDGTVYTLDTSADLPNIQGDTLYFTYEQVTGVPGTFPDGKYSFMYTVVTDEGGTQNVYNWEYTGLFFPTIKCWVKSELVNLDLAKCCNFDPTYKEIREILFVSTLLDALSVHACQGDVYKFDDTLNTLYLYKQNNFDCKTC
jgi:hypothetical protein